MSSAKPIESNSACLTASASRPYHARGPIGRSPRIMGTALKEKWYEKLASKLYKLFIEYVKVISRGDAAPATDGQINRLVYELMGKEVETVEKAIS